MRADATVFKVINQGLGENTCHGIVEAIGDTFLCCDDIRKRSVYFVQIGKIAISFDESRAIIVDSLDIISDIITPCF